MARYDAARGQSGRSGYDRAFRNFGPSWGEQPFGGGFGGHGRADRDFGGGGGGGTGGSYGEGLYGPSRYGLGPYHERLRKRRRSDAELREQVEEALFYDTWVDAEAVTVEVKDGVVTLSGELPSYEEVRYATDDAWDVDGVVGVRSDLTVRE
jgi:hypothetical protein